MRKYETIFIVNPDLEDEATEEMVDDIADTISENDGEIINLDKWGTRKLAYEVDNQQAGYYTVINFKGESATVDELKRIYRINDNIMKFLILRDE